MTEYLPYITGSGGALVVLTLMITLILSGALRTQREVKKLEEENNQLRAAYDKVTVALDTERRTLNETVAAGQVTNQLISALVSATTGKSPALAPPAPGGTARGATP